MRHHDSLFRLLAISSLLVMSHRVLAQDQAPSLSATNTMPVTSSEASVPSGPPSAVAPASATPMTTTSPLLKPVSAGKVKGVKVKKEKPPKTIHMVVEHGVLTVDGWTGKANLNYDIDDFQYFYMWAPGIGTVIVSNHPFPGAKIQYSAFDKNTLTVKIDGHQLQLSADHRILPGKPKELDAPAYVALDAGYVPDSARYPVFGYGRTNKAPYAWPGSLMDVSANKDAPPLPPALQPKIQTTTVCTKGSSATDTTKDTLAGCTSVPVPMALSKKQEKEVSKQ